MLVLLALLRRMQLWRMLRSGMLYHGECNASAGWGMLRGVELVEYLYVGPMYKGLVIILYEETSNKYIEQAFKPFYYPYILG